MMTDPRQDNFQPAIVHYHLFPGGVSALLLNSIQILVNTGKIKKKILFFLGSGEKSDWFFTQFSEKIRDRIEVEVQVIPELFYWDPTLPPLRLAANAIKAGFQIQNLLEYTLWVHNPTVGKNPALLLALKEIAAETPQQKIWMHVHDSAEQGRWPNLDLLVSSSPAPYYFTSPGTRWIVINKTDLEAFRKSGMPSEFLFYLPDPLIPPEKKEEEPKENIGSALNKYARENGFTLDLSLPWVLFAGRTIRRKNLLEALLIVICAATRTNLLVTLPADSPDDLGYDQMLTTGIKNFAKGVAGFGLSLVGKKFSLNALAAASDLVISCSVMEGFGLPYLEFPMLGCPLLAKKHAVMDDFAEIFSDLPHLYFDEILVPADPAMRKEQANRYEKKIENLASHFGLSPKRKDPVHTFFKAHFEKPFVNFGYLSATAQITLIKSLVDNRKMDTVRAKNPIVFENFEKGLKWTGISAQKVSAAITTVFGPDPYFEKFSGLLDSHSKPAEGDLDPAKFSENLLEVYFTPPHLRLLLDYKPFDPQ